MGIVLLLSAASNLIGVLQFRRVVKGLGPEAIPVGYWTNAISWMSMALTAMALVLVIYFTLTA